MAFLAPARLPGREERVTSAPPPAATQRAALQEVMTRAHTPGPVCSLYRRADHQLCDDLRPGLVLTAAITSTHRTPATLCAGSGRIGTADPRPSSS